MIANQVRRAATRGGGGGGLIIHDDFSSLADEADLAGNPASVISNGNNYAARSEIGRALVGSTSAKKKAGNLAGGNGGLNSGAGIDIGVPAYKASILFPPFTVNSTYVWVGGSTTDGDGALAAYYLKLLPSANLLRLYSGTTTIVNSQTIIYTDGVKISIEFEPAVRVAMLVDDVVIYEKTSGVLTGNGNNSGIGFDNAALRIYDFKVEAL